MKNSLRSLAILIAAFAVSLAVQAAGTATGVVTRVIPQVNGTLLVFQNGTASGQPSCATSAGWFSVDSSTEAGRQMIDWLRMAKVLGTTVTFTGTGACASGATTVEQLSYPDIAQ